MTLVFAIFPKWLAYSLLLIVASPFNHVTGGIQSFVNAQDIESPQFDFKTIQASVFGVNHQPVEPFSATIRLVRHPSSFQSEITLAKLTCESAQGQLRIILSASERTAFAKAASDDRRSGHSRHWIVLRISATGYIQRRLQIPASEFNGQFPCCQLRESIKLVGRFKNPTTELDTRPISGRVTIIEKLGTLPSANQYDQRFIKTIPLNENGSFELRVPKSSHLLLVAQTASSSPLAIDASAAPTADATADENANAAPIINIGQRSLPPGVVVKGIVVDRDNSPVARQIVQLYQPRNDIQFMDTSIRVHAITNSLGQFAFPPFIGDVEISLVREGTTIDGRHIKTPNAPLAAAPIELELQPDNPLQFLEIKEARLHRIYGNIKVPEATTASEFAIRLWRRQDASSTRWVTVDDRGTFDFELLEGAGYRMEFRHVASHQRHQASLDESTGVDLARLFSAVPLVPTNTFQIKPLKNKTGPLNFEILPRKSNRQ
jgi:hypothetical protein